MTEDNRTFRRLQIENWRQFLEVDIEFHDRLTVLTGSNGAGKSTLLRILSRHFGFDRPFLAVPVKSKSGGYAYLSGIFRSLLKRPVANASDQNSVGRLTYKPEAVVPLSVPHNIGLSYALEFNMRSVQGIHVDSHQPISVYQPVGQIPTHIISSQQAYQNYDGEIRQRFSGGYGGSSPIFRMKEAIISMAMFGEGNKYAPGNKVILDAYLGFVSKLREVLPRSLGFLDLEIRTPEVVVKTETGEFLLDAASGGLMTLIDLVWRLHMFSLNHESFVVTMDEPENHLHPSMQRGLLGGLLQAFPTAQFIVATHSPFVVSSVKDSNVFVLRYAKPDLHGSDNTSDRTMISRIVSERLDTVNKAGSAGEILREVLGVPTTFPQWVEDDIQRIVVAYRDKPLTPEVLKELRRELSSKGFEEMYPEALAAVVDGK